MFDLLIVVALRVKFPQLIDKGYAASEEMFIIRSSGNSFVGYSARWRNPVAFYVRRLRENHVPGIGKVTNVTAHFAFREIPYSF